VKFDSAPPRSGRTVIAVAALVALLAVTGCAGSDAGNPDSRLSLEQATQPLSGAPAPLTEIRDQANQLLGGGADAFERRLAALRGHPVVVNNWASWCGPCRFEFPFLQSQASKHARDVAFLGVDSEDSESAARDFLAQIPLPYPSYSDPDKAIRQELRAIGYPATVFYDRMGNLIYSHQGQYRSEADLATDIDRYALSG
jgi:cytochrome c biogenesis protein CcmG, thiol:disulfide interchange protein DsbE